MLEKIQDPKEPKSHWKTIIDVISCPVDFLHHWSSKSPLLTVLAVVFLLQPVISTGIDLINELRHVKTALNPEHRPVTEQELDIVNKRVDFLQQLILAMESKQNTSSTHHVTHHAKSSASTSTSQPAPMDPKTEMQTLQTQLATVQQKLDAAYTKQTK